MAFSHASIRALLFALLIGTVAFQHADAQTYKPLPPQGIDLPSETTETLQKEAQRLRLDLESLIRTTEDASVWRADVEIFLRAVEVAMEQGLFYLPKDVELVQRAAAITRQRLEAVSKGTRGLDLLVIGSSRKDDQRTLAGGFASSIDGSVQPYGVVLPEGKLAIDGKPLRMDVWLHGRGDTITEVPFLLDRLDKVGEYSPAGVIVLHPFGRHCNAFKFAGETDVYEAIKQVKSIFPIDSKRISIRGFSMGGAGCWHLAAHDPGRWFAANPGAGFVDTINYQGWNKSMPYDPGDWGRKLMMWYDVPPWVENLTNTQVVVYSGELDKQRAAAETMIAAAKNNEFFARSGSSIEHVVGQGMAHKIDASSANAIDQRLAFLESQTQQKIRTKIHFVTYTLRYSQMDWLTVEGMEEHWKKAVVDAEIDDTTIRISTENVSALKLDFSTDGWPMKSGYLTLEIDGQSVDGPAVIQGKPSRTQWAKQDDIWDLSSDEWLIGKKRPGVQGPIDDALTAPFLFVLPSRPCRHGVVQRFVDRELQQARASWRRIMRGDDRVVIDKDLTPEQIANFNLVCFGDFQSNRYLANIASALPMGWTDDRIVVGDVQYDPSMHALVMVYPNPQAPDRYIVVNSGITFREFSNSTNSRQIAMLPDWAVINVNQPSDGIFPGKIAAADFFDESWKLRPTVPATSR